MAPSRRGSLSPRQPWHYPGVPQAAQAACCLPPVFFLSAGCGHRAEALAAGLAQRQPTSLACQQRCSCCALGAEQVSPALSLLICWGGSAPLGLRLCAATSSALAQTTPGSGAAVSSRSIWISSPVFRTETVQAAQGRARCQCPSEVLAVPVNTSCTQAGLSSHFVFQGRSLSEEVLCHTLCHRAGCTCLCV